MVTVQSNRHYSHAFLTLAFPFFSFRSVVRGFRASWCCDLKDRWLPAHAQHNPLHKPSSPCLLASWMSPAAQLSSCKHLIRLMHSAQAENSIYHSYSNEFPLRWQIQPHHVRKSSQPLAFKEHTHLTCRKWGLCVVSLPLSCWTKK